MSETVPTMNDSATVLDYIEYHLGGDVYLVANNFKDRRMVHIRQYEKKSDGKKFPTKKGVCMSPDRYASLVSNLETIQQMYDEVNGPSAINGANRTVHIGGPLYASVTADYKCINLRNFFCLETGKVVPTRFGVALTIPMWTELVKVGPTLKESDPVLKNATGCFGIYFHHNQLGFFECRECNPFQSQVTPTLPEPLSPITTTTFTTTTTEAGSVMKKKRPAAKKLKLNICENTCSF
jgi:Transcriptional Coactivator p15 (PC4)